MELKGAAPARTRDLTREALPEPLPARSKGVENMRAKIAAAVVVTSSLWEVVTPAHAATSEQPAIASFEGRNINLADGWYGAKACLVWHERGIIECFASDAEFSQAEQTLSASAPAVSAGAQTSTQASPASSSACSSPLHLYSGADYTKRQLAFYDRGYWQELSDYGFADSTVSFIGGACAFHLANGTWGSGKWYPGNTAGYSFSTNMGSWDNTVQSIYIE